MRTAAAGALSKTSALAVTEAHDSTRPHFVETDSSQENDCGQHLGDHSVSTSVLRGLRAHDAHALLHVGSGATVGEQDAVEARPNRSLREEAPRFLVDLELIDML
jgi:hypothetical protein